jgi:hypothetical protein
MYNLVGELTAKIEILKAGKPYNHVNEQTFINDHIKSLEEIKTKIEIFLNRGKEKRVNFQAEQKKHRFYNVKRFFIENCKGMERNKAILKAYHNFGKDYIKLMEYVMLFNEVTK